MKKMNRRMYIKSSVLVTGSMALASIPFEKLLAGEGENSGAHQHIEDEVLSKESKPGGVTFSSKSLLEPRHLSADDCGIALNHDSSNFFSTRAGKPLTLETVDELIDQYAGTRVTQLLFNPNCMRTSYGSRVWDPIWRDYLPDGPDDQPLLASLSPEGRVDARKWIHTAWALDKAGIDVYTRWIARARHHGISPWISMRMNDVHNADDERCYIHSEFWRMHPEFRRIPYHFNTLTDRAFDYGIKDVREYHFRLIEELADRYDFDGLELDWMRFGFHFRPGHEAEGAELLTEFTGRVRRLLDSWQEKRGHRIRLGARVASRPQTALGLGMDAVSWAHKGFIDWLVVTPFWATAETDMPVELWRSLLDGTNVELCAGMEVLLRPYPESKLFQTNSLETMRGAACSFMNRGADQIYLFNYMDSVTTIDKAEDMPQLLRETGNLQAMEAQPRRIVLTYADTLAMGETQVAALPADIATEGWKTFRLHIGRRPVAGNAFVILAFHPDKGVKGNAVSVHINGVNCIGTEAVTLLKPCPEEQAWRYSAPVNALVDGYNIIELQSKMALTVIWVEIELRA
jgi:hypothetical protein